jgi:hypothetical protein
MILPLIAAYLLMNRDFLQFWSSHLSFVDMATFQILISREAISLAGARKRKQNASCVLSATESRIRP